MRKNNFSDDFKLGKGGFGPGYKGVLPNGKEIAVKRLLKASGQGMQEFMNEVLLISKLQHRNLVRLMGCSVENKEKMLIYEYMPNKSLDVFLKNQPRMWNDSHIGSQTQSVQFLLLTILQNLLSIEEHELLAAQAYLVASKSHTLSFLKFSPFLGS